MARRLLVAGQLSLAVVLLTGATLLMRTLRNLQAVDPGFQTTNVLRVDYSLPESRYPRDFGNWPNWVEVNGFNRELIDRVAALPGARSAAVVTNHPLDPGFTNSFQIEGRPATRSRVRSRRAWSHPATSRPWGYACWKAGSRPRRTGRPIRT